MDFPNRAAQTVNGGVFIRYVSFPLALAAAIGLEPGDEVQWKLLDRTELHLLRVKTTPTTAKSNARKS